MSGFYVEARSKNGELYEKTSPDAIRHYDLHVDGLEALWVETKVNQTTLLICSLYRPPSARATYWELIEESIKRASDMV